MEGPLMGVRRSQRNQLKKKSSHCCMKEKGVQPIMLPSQLSPPRTQRSHSWQKGTGRRHNRGQRTVGHSQGSDSGSLTCLWDCLIQFFPKTRNLIIIIFFKSQGSKAQIGATWSVSLYWILCDMLTTLQMSYAGIHLRAGWWWLSYL